MVEKMDARPRCERSRKRERSSFSSATAGGKTGQAVDARIVVAVFEAFVGGDWNAEQLCDLLLRIAKSFAFVAEAFSDFLTLFCGGRGHDSVVVELLGRRSV